MTRFCGTSGYDYKYWSPLPGHETFYPANCKNKLQFYSQEFNLIELNCTFYRLPTEKAVKNWYDTTPDNFKFITKFSQYITHSKRFKDFESGWDKFMDPIKHLREKLLGVLFQFGPEFNYTSERAELFTQAEEYMESTKRDYKDFLNRQGSNNKVRSRRPLIYVEFRHQSWFTEEAIQLIEDLGWVLVIPHYHDDRLTVGNIVTKPNHIMLRMHGTWDFCRGDYSDEQLAILASEIYDIPNIVVTFNNVDTLDGEIKYQDHIQNIANMTGASIEQIKQQIPDKTFTLLDHNMTVNLPHAIKNCKTMSNLLDIQYIL